MAETTRRGTHPAGDAPPPPAQVAELLKEAAATRAAVEDRLRVLRRIATWLAAFVAAVTLLVALVLVILIQNRQTSAKTRAAITTNAALSAVIADCTRVGGKCYEQQQANLRATINLLVQSNKAIAQCARTTATDAELDACVNAKLAAITPGIKPPAR